MKAFNRVVGILAAGLLAVAGASVKAAEMQVFSDPERADADFKFQGEYADPGAELGAEMRRQAGFHRQLAGHRLRGPFKHYWSEASRYTGDDRPFSLFLATGVPFEVTDRPARDGWTFLSDADAAAAADGKLVSGGTRFLSRSALPTTAGVLDPCEETPAALFAFKHRIRSGLGKVPFVENDEPAVLAWYPSAHAALLWKVRSEPTSFLVRGGAQTREISLTGLESALLPDLYP